MRSRRKTGRSKRPGQPAQGRRATGKPVGKPAPTGRKLTQADWSSLQTSSGPSISLKQPEISGLYRIRRIQRQGVFYIFQRMKFMVLLGKPVTSLKDRPMTHPALILPARPPLIIWLGPTTEPMTYPPLSPIAPTITVPINFQKS